MATYPSKHDGPSQIRTYLMNVLILRHDLSPADANSVASSWRFGREHDLREASQKKFQNIFGDIGFYLYNSVSEDMASAWHSTHAGALNLLLLYGMPILAMILLFRLYLHTQRASLASGTLHLERLLWVSGPILLICNAQEAAHHTKLSGECFELIGALLSAFGFFAMVSRFIRTVERG